MTLRPFAVPGGHERRTIISDVPFAPPNRSELVSPVPGIRKVAIQAVLGIMDDWCCRVAGPTRGNKPAIGNVGQVFNLPGDCGNNGRLKTCPTLHFFPDEPYVVSDGAILGKWQASPSPLTPCVVESRQGAGQAHGQFGPASAPD